MRLRINGSFVRNKVLVPSSVMQSGLSEVWRHTGIQRSMTRFFYINRPLKKGFYSYCPSSIAGYARTPFGIYNMS